MNILNNLLRHIYLLHIILIIVLFFNFTIEEGTGVNHRISLKNKVNSLSNILEKVSPVSQHSAYEKKDAVVETNCRKAAGGGCLTDIPVFKTNAFPKKIYKAAIFTYKLKGIRYSNLHLSKPRRVPMKFWSKSDWLNPSEKNKKLYNLSRDKSEFVGYSYLGKESDESMIKTYIQPGGPTLTLRRTNIAFESYTKESSQLLKRSQGIKADYSVSIPGTSVSLGGGSGLKGSIEGTMIKGTTVGRSVVTGETSYTNACLTICCPVWAYLAKFQNKYRVKYAAIGSVWVDYYQYHGNKYMGTITIRFQYSINNNQYTYMLEEPGSVFTSIATEYVSPNNMGFEYCTSAEIKSKDCVEASRRLRQSPQCAFGGSKP
ncbi:MAG: hypothetical protein ACK4R6_02290 [Spirosomataceae bacterium]